MPKRNLSENHKKILSKSAKRRGIKPPSRKGIPHTDETKRKMSLSRKGWIPPHWLDDQRKKEVAKKISQAKRGKIPWNKGKTGIYKLSEETKRKISERLKIVMKGRHFSPETEFKKGHKHSEEVRRKISQSQIGREISKETRRKISEAFRGSRHPLWGKHRSEETKGKIRNAKIELYKTNFWLKTKISNSVKKLWQNPEYRQAHTGPNHRWWKGGITKREETLAHALRVELRNWTKEILERDNYTCQKCGRRFEKIFLHVHHVKPISKYPSLALDTSNGITLCKNCHLETESYGKKLGKEVKKLLNIKRKQFVNEIIDNKLSIYE